jgi:hypothetical protein
MRSLCQVPGHLRGDFWAGTAGMHESQGQVTEWSTSRLSQDRTGNKGTTGSLNTKREQNMSYPGHRYWPPVPAGSHKAGPGSPRQWATEGQQLSHTAAPRQKLGEGPQDPWTASPTMYLDVICRGLETWDYFSWAWLFAIQVTGCKYSC